MADVKCAYRPGGNLPRTELRWFVQPRILTRATLTTVLFLWAGTLLRMRPGVPSFHDGRISLMSIHASRTFTNGEFKSEKWCHEQGIADTHLLPAKVLKLARLIATSGLSFPVLSITEKSLFDEIIKPRIKAEKNPRYELLRNVYYFSYSRLLALLFRRIQELNDVLPQGHRISPLDVFVDKNGKLSKKANDLFFGLKKLADPTRHALFGVADHCDDKTTVPLQCADLLLGQLRQFYIGGEYSDATHILLTATIPPFTMCRLDWTRKNLEEFVEHLSELPPQHWEQNLHDNDPA